MTSTPAPALAGWPSRTAGEQRAHRLLRVVSETRGDFDVHGSGLAALDAAVKTVLDRGPDELSDPQINDELTALEAVKRQVIARTTQLAGTVARRQAARSREANPRDPHAGSKGERQAAQDLAGLLGLDTQDANRLVKNAHEIDRMTPDTRQATTSGALPVGHVRILNDQLLKHLTGDLRRQVEAEMVDLGTTLGSRQFSAACRRRLGQLDATALATDDRRRRDRRNATISDDPDGTVYLGAKLAGIDAETVRTALAAFTTPDTDGMPRTPGQRTADALVALARFGLDHAHLPITGGFRPHVTVVATLADLIDETGIGELAHTGPISTRELRTILDDASVSRVITGPDSLAIDVGRATRTCPTGARRALDERDGHCTYGRCTVPANRCQAAHLNIRWIQGAGTSAHEQGLLCLMHHQLVDRLGLIGRIIDGQVVWERPPEG